MRPIAVAVTSAHIKEAVKGDSHKCMIADAIHGAVPWAKYVMVDLQSIRVTDAKQGRRYIYLTPPTAQKALLQFDSGKRVRPFSFTLSQGHSRKMRVRAPGFVRVPSSNYKRNAARYMPTRVREFGVRKITKQQIAKATAAA